MKSIFSAGALLLCSALAHAQSATWTFSYTGFYDRQAAVFLSDAQLQGSFSGSDANADGVLERTELTSLLIGTKNYIACAGDSNATYHCGADSFTFSSKGGLAFSLGESGGDTEGWVGGGHVITTGDTDVTWHYDPNSSYEHNLDWTSATRLTLANHTELGGADVGIGAIQLGQIPAVPEAANWSMLLAGLAGIGGLKVLRRKGTPRG
jgi:hypothetical protein